MNKILLKLAMLPRGLWRGMGADVDQLQAILDVRLKLDDRKPIPIGRQRASKKDRKNSTLINIFLSVVMGAMYMLPVLIVPDRIMGLTIYFTTFLFILTFMLITDFSNVLFDTRDKFIIVPRPINDATIVLSRLLHVFIYLFRIVLPMSLPGWIALGVVDGWKSTTIFIVPLILMVCISVFLVNGIYLLVLKLAKPERFKNVMNYFQILFSIIFFSSTFAVNAMLQKFVKDNNEIGKIDIDFSKFTWVKFLPSYWLASFWSLIGFPAKIIGTQWLVILAIIFPLICLWLLVKYLAPQFGRAIGSIDVVASAEYKTVAVATGKTTQKSLYLKLADMLNKNDTARAGFIITWLQSSRSRAFKMKIYPALAIIPVYIVYMLYISKGNKTISEFWHELSDKPSISLLILYYTSFVLVQAFINMNSSDQYKASWVYYATPIAPGQVMGGAFKAIWVKIFLPLFTALSVLILVTWGWKSVADILLAMTNITLFALCMLRVQNRNLPFSLQENINQGGNRFIKSIISMAIPGAFGFGHYLAIHMLWLKLLFMVLSGILLWLVWDSYTNTSWDDIKKLELE